MLNTIVLIGRLTRDPELRYTSTGTAVVNFGIAVNRGFKSKVPDAPTADFFNVTCWNRLAEIVAEYMVKGRLVAVQGRLQSRTAEKDGQRRTYVEIVADTVKFLESKDSVQDDEKPLQRGNRQAPNTKPSYDQSKKQYGAKQPTAPMNFDNDEDDDLPFYN